MDYTIHIKMNEKLYLRNPEQSELGRKIVKYGLEMITKLGFEEFTFKKLANAIHTTEAGIYRYFENKHKLLIYLSAYYWSIMEYRIVFGINNLSDTEKKIKKIIELLVIEPESDEKSDFISSKLLYQLIMWEGSKAYLTRHIGTDNKDRLFKPYKDLCARFSSVITEYNPKFKFPHSLASTVVEMAHAQKFFKNNLPALTDFPNEKDNKKLLLFLENLVFSTINKGKA